MKTKRYDKRFLPMLWIGLVIWLGSMLISLVMEWTGKTPAGQETLMDMGKWMFQNVPVLTLLLFCVLQPILEEFAFRLWGEGKKWITIVCLVLMAAFSVSEIGLWGLLLVAAVAVAWFGVRDRYVQMWACALISALGFALCHISGFGEFSVGMVLGLTDIFGFALVLSWLAINFSIWLAALLHVLNNSFAILIPMLFLSDPISLPCYTLTDGVKAQDYTISIEPLKPFVDNGALIANADKLYNLDSSTTEFYMVGEPAQIASWLATNALGDKERYTYFDWRPKGESMEERVVLRVKDIAPGRLRSDLLLKDYLNVMEQYADEPLLFDTTEVMLKEVWLVYPDGHEVLFEQGCDDYNEASRRILSSSMGVGGNVLVTEYEQVNDSTMVPHDYCLMRDNPLASTFESMNEMMDRLSGFRLDYRDARKATLIIVK
ncbi:MAG: CPBP family intramembrane metalloprotease [Bacteroidales bacterium]|nr:CPBP family intramembrane metalloprotease [Bacteroidales bacterium]